jgi:hypothetical protein
MPQRRSTAPASSARADQIRVSFGFDTGADY